MVTLRLLLLLWVVLCGVATAARSRNLQADADTPSQIRPLDGQSAPVTNSAAAAVIGAEADASRDRSDTATAATASGKSIPTATGGLVYTLLVFLTGVAFVGNGAFLVYVFWLSK